MRSELDTLQSQLKLAEKEKKALTMQNEILKKRRPSLRGTSVVYVRPEPGVIITDSSAR